MDKAQNEYLELGTWVGRGQAFGVIANGSAAAQAECLRQIHDSGTYKQTGLTWEDFCPQYTGLSRQRVDTLINNLNEFGKTFFDLTEVVRISPEAYRRVASKVKDNSIQIGTELVPIVPENAARIRRAVQEARTQTKRAWHEVRALNANTNLLMMQFENCFNRCVHLAGHALISQAEHDQLTMILEYVRGQAERLEETLDRSPRAKMRE